MSDICFGIVRVLFIVSVASAAEKPSLENRDVELHWNITPQSAAQLVQIVHPSNKQMFAVFGRQAIDAGSGFNGRYNFTGDITTGDIDFVLSAVTRADAGTYSSRIGSTKLDGVILVVYLQPQKPGINVNTEPTVGSSIIVNCSTRSNSVPAGHKQPMFYRWYADGNKVTNGGRYQLSGSQLTLTGITRSDNGMRIACTTEETPTLPSDFSEVYSVTVQYGPGAVRLSPTSTSYTLLETTDTLGPITCSADCKPSCTYQWKHDGTDVTPTGTVLQVKNIIRRQAGNYICTATNKHNTQGRMSDAVSVVVEYAPSNTQLIITEDENVTENSTVTFTCTTDSFPPSTLQLIYSGGGEKTVTTKHSTVNSTFTKKKADCFDTGNYVCNARNKVGNSSSNSKCLNVLCSPRLYNREILNTQQGLDDGEDLNITGIVLAHPKPKIFWSFRKNESQDSKILINNTDKFEYIITSEFIIYKSHALRTKMRTKDFGQYLLNVSNDIGYHELIFDIFLQRRPEPPMFVKVKCTYFDTAEIVWISKFNGGNKQHFRIGVKTSNDVNFKQINLYNDPGQEKVITGIVTNLNARTTYFFTVFAINNIGSTSTSNFLHCETPEYRSSNRNIDTGPNAASTVLFALSTLLFVASVTGFVIRYMIKRRKLQNKRAMQEESKGNDTMHTYEAVGEHKQPSHNYYQEIVTSANDNTNDTDVRNVYTELGPHDLPNVYEKMKPHKKAKVYENTCFNQDT